MASEHLHLCVVKNDDHLESLSVSVNETETPGGLTMALSFDKPPVNIGALVFLAALAAYQAVITMHTKHPDLCSSQINTTRNYS